MVCNGARVDEDFRLTGARILLNAMARIHALQHRVRFTAERLSDDFRNAHPAAVSAGAPLLVSVHVPKTAGTSFRRLLGVVYGRGLVYDYGPRNPMTHRLLARGIYSGDAEVESELRRAVRESRVQCIHGHLVARSYHALFPEARFAYWLRDPVERVISLYHSHMPRLKPGQERFSSMDLLEYAQQEENRDVQSRMVGGVPEEKVLFVGICERFADSLERFAAATGLAVAPREAHLNTSVRRPRVDDPQVRAKIAALNEQDVTLYRIAVQGLGPGSNGA